MRRPKDWIFLYVPDQEREEALFLGALRVEGDARLVVPNPMPPGATLAAFDRWRTTQAKYRWCYSLVQGILADIVDPESELKSKRRRETPIDPDMTTPEMKIGFTPT